MPKRITHIRILTPENSRQQLFTLAPLTVTRLDQTKMTKKFETAEKHMDIYYSLFNYVF